MNRTDRFRARYASPWQGSLLLLAGLASAEAQSPRSGRTTSAVGELFPDTASTAARTGTLRQLVCRGVAGLHIPIQQDPSPRNQRQVAVSLSYQRNSKAAGAAYEQLDPGACSWNPLGDPNVPAEPGIVHFDLDREGAEQIPDPARLAHYGSRDPFQVFFSCDTGGNLSPYKTAKAEWNAVIMDLDRTRYPGAKATEQFVRRSQPLRNGSTLMFEVRGYVTVTRE